MYFTGVFTPGSPGTPSWYDNCFNCGVILSAISKDNGLTFAQEAGIRINPLVQGPVIGGAQFNNTNVAAVKTTENGKIIYRIYSPSLTDGTVSYVSEDGLNFTLEGQVPAPNTDPRATVLPDGRIWFSIDPDGVIDTMVFGPQAFAVNSVRADVGTLPASGFPKPFQSALSGVTGNATTPVSLSVVSGSGSPSGDGTPPFTPSYYSFSPSGGFPSVSTVVSFVGPATYAAQSQLAIHAQAGDSIAAGAIYCMTQPLGRAGNSVFCQPQAPALPMNKLTFNLFAASAPSSQTSNILFNGGNGYRFSASSSVSWATVTPSGTAPAPLIITVNPSGLAPGAYTGSITISAENTAEVIAVTAVVAGAPLINSVQDAATYSPTITPNGFATIFGSGFTATPLSWAPTAALPTSLGGVKVQIDGKDAYISYADFGQVNVLVPPDSNSGTVTVSVTTPGGIANSTVTMAPVKPGWFAYTVGASTWIAAQISNTATLVAPTGILGGAASRPAAAGDFITLYANGFGATTPAAPAGTVFSGAYPVANPSQLSLTIGGKSVPVLFAGEIAAGLYQVNAQVPAGLGQGDLAVLMTVNGQTTQTASLNFQ